MLRDYMDVAVVGLHKRFCDELFFEKVYGYIKHIGFHDEDMVLLMTCNRIEIYLASPYISERHPELIQKIKQPFQENMEKRFYTFMGSDVLKHLAQVASGLDSLIYGESDIQHQVKKAYENYGKGFNRDGHFLFQKALHISKKLRTEFRIKPVKSLIDHVVSSIEPLLFKGAHLAFIGNSDLNQQIYRKLHVFKDIRCTLISSIQPQIGNPFKDVDAHAYQELESLGPFNGVICSTKDRRIEGSLKLQPEGWVFDLSRPKVFFQPLDQDLYFDLNYFEQQELKNTSSQQSIRYKALQYIEENVQRLMVGRHVKLLGHVS